MILKFFCKFTVIKAITKLKHKEFKQKRHLEK